MSVNPKQNLGIYLYIIQQKELCRWDSPVSTGVLEDLEAESGSTNLEADVSDSGT